jgi:hypothetical protein
VPAALLAQNRQRRLGGVHRAEEHGLDLIAERLVAHVLDRGEVGVAGVVHDDIEPAERVERGLHGGGRLRGHGDIVGDRAQANAMCREEVLQGLGATRGGDHAISALERGLDDVAAETAGASCDEPNLGHERRSFLNSWLAQ